MVRCPAQNSGNGLSFEILASTVLWHVGGRKTILRCCEQWQLPDWTVNHLGPTALHWFHGVMDWPRLICWPPLSTRDKVIKKYQSCSSIAEVLVLSEYPLFPQLWPMASYTVSVCSSVSGMQVPFPVINKMLSRDIFYDLITPFPTIRGCITLSPDDLVIFLLLPWTPLGCLYSSLELSLMNTYLIKGLFFLES